MISLSTGFGPSTFHVLFCESPGRFARCGPRRCDFVFCRDASLPFVTLQWTGSAQLGDGGGGVDREDVGMGNRRKERGWEVFFFAHFLIAYCAWHVVCGVWSSGSAAGYKDSSRLLTYWYWGLRFSWLLTQVLPTNENKKCKKQLTPCRATSALPSACVVDAAF